MRRSYGNDTNFQNYTRIRYGKPEEGLKPKANMQDHNLKNDCLTCKKHAQNNNQKMCIAICGR